MNDVARKNAEIWFGHVLLGDAKKMAGLYAIDAVLLPTCSGKIRRGRLEIEEYFREDFFPKKPAGEFTDDDQIVQAICASLYGDSALYHFNTTHGVLYCRFNRFWKKTAEGYWQIINHQSSVNPIT